MNITRLKNVLFSLVILTGLSFSNVTFADTAISAIKLAEIENSVRSMGVNQLNNRMIALQEEQEELESKQGSTQSPSANKGISERPGSLVIEHKEYSLNTWVGKNNIQLMLKERHIKSFKLIFQS